MSSLRTMVAFTASVFAATLLATGAAAQGPLGIGTSGQGTSTFSMGSAIAKIAAEKAGLQVLVQPQGGTGKVVPLVNTGQLAFGLANILEVTNAVKGRGPFADKPNPNLKIVGVMYPFRVGFFVDKDSPIRTMADIKGKKIGSGYTSQRIIGILVNAMLANAGLTMDDMEQVPVENIVRQADDFIAGKLDVGFFALGAGKVNEIDAARGGIRFLSIGDSPEAVAGLQSVVPQSYAQPTAAASGITGVVEDVNMMAYDYLLYAGAHVPDDQIYALTKAIATGKDDLAASFGPFAGLDPKKMRKDIGLDYHPGALRYYTEAGI